MLRIGLTGGIGSGKSEVSRRLAARGVIVIDADKLAREVVEPGTDGLAEVVEAFGADVLAADGSLDRPALGARVFGDDAARARLEAIIHPRVRARGTELEAAAGPDDVVVHDIPLLVETGQADRFDGIIVVDAPVEAQVERLVGRRGMAEAQARERIAAQASREQRTGVADWVVDNTGSLDDLEAAVARVWKELRARADG
ncbi:MAG TPA: dephospho-CoA kinase [Nocardioidaceae bacterium]|nr:dephospho-CoA kinase [Nocardioidaceae bacterium]